MRKNEMNAKKLLVSFLLIASVLFLATAVVSAAVPNFSVNSVKIDNTEAVDTTVNAGDTVLIKVEFTSNVDARDVVVKVELGNAEVEKYLNSIAKTEKEYTVSLTLKVPSDFNKDEIEDTMHLRVSIDGEEISTGDDFENTDYDEIITVFRQPYEFAIKSVTVDSSIDAGEKLPVEVVLKNVGYNNAEDVYVTVSIPELNIEKSAYLGDLVTKHYLDEESEDDDDQSTVSKTLYLEVPYNTQAGDYTLVVTAESDEVTNTAEGQITIKNSISDVAIKSGNDLILLNPTSKLVVYTVKYNANEEVVVVPAESSKSVSIETPTGDYDFDVIVYSGDSIASTVNFSGSSASEMQLTNPVFVLTVILAVVFLVLLVVLVVLITKKPQKTEEFGESYY